MNAIVSVPVTTPSLSFEEVERLAVNIARSGLFGIRTPEQAVTLMMIAQAEGMHPALAARDYDIIQGRPSKKSEAMLRDFLRAGGRVEWHALSDTEADATFSHPQGGSARISWNMERAAKAGLRQKENYTKFPRQMLRSRAVSEGVRTVWPSATSGFYVPEEAAEMAPHPGPTLDAVAEPSSPVDPVTQPDPEAEALENARRFTSQACEQFRRAGTQAAITAVERNYARHYSRLRIAYPDLASQFDEAKLQAEERIGSSNPVEQIAERGADLLQGG